MGSTSRSLSRTGWERPHLGQLSSLAVKVPNCCDISLRVFVLQLDLLNLDEGDHDFFRGVTALHLQVEIIGGDAADPLAGIFAAGLFDHQHHVPVRIPANDAEEAGELGLEKAAVEGELAALVFRGGRRGGLVFSPLEVPQFHGVR